MPAAAAAFDGRWSVTMACPTAEDGALGYTWRFDARVVNGVLHGDYGTQGMPASMSLDGQIGAGGAASLSGALLSGQPQYAVRRVGPGTPVHFTVNAQFNAERGAGTRREIRPCFFTFVRR